MTRSPAVSGLAATPTVRLHPDELTRLGGAAGASVRITSSRGSVTLPVAADRAVPEGVAWMSCGAAGDLIDVASVMAVTVEVAAHG
jgi:NADH-quinone oxidoreductase subunit G